MTTNANQTNEVKLSDETKDFISTRLIGKLQSNPVGENGCSAKILNALENLKSSVFYNESRFPTSFH